MTRLGSFDHSQSISTTISMNDQSGGILTLFAGFVFSFSKIFCDWAFDAIAMMNVGVRCTKSVAEA